MDEERIGLVLARASELRLKITNCIHKLSSTDELKTENKEFEEDEETSDTLWNIRDALEALEAQLSSLQALQQQQWYEKEAALTEIEFSQKKLLKRLEEYEGKYLEVITEAIAFVGETVDDNNDLLLPPYSSRPSPALGSDSEYISQFTITRKYPRNGLLSNGQREESSKGVTSTDKNQRVPESKSPLRVIKMLLGAAAKTTFTVVGVICILSLAGFEPRLRKRANNQFSIWGLLAQQEENSEKKGKTVECPAGRIPVIEDGEVRCLVKERVEVPFGSVVVTPDVDYGCG